MSTVLSARWTAGRACYDAVVSLNIMLICCCYVVTIKLDKEGFLKDHHWNQEQAALGNSTLPTI